jgi:hypothetical protein
MPTGRIVRPVPGSMPNTEGSPFGETTFVKAVFGVETGGGGCKFAEEGPGGASDAGEVPDDVESGTAA